jgi:glycosyltransferase involved in cell wall biosynthesis
MVEHGRNGILIEPGDIEGLAAALTLLASDADLRRRFARQIEVDAKAFAYDRVSVERASLLKSLLKKGAGHLREVGTLAET